MNENEQPFDAIDEPQVYSVVSRISREGVQIVLTFGCKNKEQAEILNSVLQNTAWINVETNNVTTYATQDDSGLLS